MIVKLQEAVIADQQEKIGKIQAEKAELQAQYDQLLASAKEEISAHGQCRVKLATVESQLQSAKVVAQEVGGLKSELELSQKLARKQQAELAQAEEKIAGINRKILRLQQENTQLQERLSQRPSGAELEKGSARIAQLEAEVAALVASAHEKDELLDKATALAEQFRPRLESLTNHVDKGNKMLAGIHATCEELRRKMAYVTRVNELLQRKAVYSVAGVIDFFLLSTNRDWLGDEYAGTPYCVYIGIDYDGRGLVVFEHKGELVVRAGESLPISSAQSAELLARIMELPVAEFIAGVREGDRIAQEQSVLAHAHPEAVSALQETANHIRTSPDGQALIADYRLVAGYVKLHRAEEKQRAERRAKSGGSQRRGR